MWRSTKYIVKDKNGYEYNSFKNFNDALEYINELSFKNIETTIEIIDADIF